MDSIQQQNRSNRIFTIIKRFETVFPDEFEKCGIKQCGHCGNSGFSNIHQMTHCTRCGGMGYVGFEKLDGEFVCRSCNGFGCKSCEYKGTVDWVTHATGNDIIKGKYI
jgi:hypothetical protein